MHFEEQENNFYVKKCPSLVTLTVENLVVLDRFFSFKHDGLLHNKENAHWATLVFRPNIRPRTGSINLITP